MSDAPTKFSSESLLSSDTQGRVIASALLVVLIAAVVVVYEYNSANLPTTRSTLTFGNFQIQSTSVGVTGINRTDLDLRFKALIYNPNSWGATIDEANYTVYVNGRHLGSGQSAEEYDLSPHTSQNLIFPIGVSWKSAFGSLASYVIGWGHVTWEVRGDADIGVGGISISVPFDFTTT
jgi:LEA14-like dessication related protein